MYRESQYKNNLKWSMPKEDYDALPTIAKLKRRNPLLLHRAITNHLTVCLRCGRLVDEDLALFDGYGCPYCQSPSLMRISEPGRLSRNQRG